ncbi:hypothetical protein [Patulibacter sp.]|uniref:hypothetical protein n=1 Tax=Patulibacter sp. TaxID=1912859 RepID=UPI002725A68F|nr:hypothetical protein [Patulibacter sp.]MDO9407428.1 hypothetical protein [Patulibacter sp.]
MSTTLAGTGAAERAAVTGSAAATRTTGSGTRATGTRSGTAGHGGAAVVAPPGPLARPAPDPLPPGHPLGPLEHLGLGDVRLIAVPDVHLGATSLLALVGDPLASIAPLVRLHRLRPSGEDGRPGTRDDDLVRAFRRLREDGAGLLVLHRDERDPMLAAAGPAPTRPDPGTHAPRPPGPRPRGRVGRRPLGVPEASPALEVLAASIAAIGLRPARLLVCSDPEPDALDPRDVGLPVVRRIPFGAARPRPSALVGA